MSFLTALDRSTRRIGRPYAVENTDLSAQVAATQIMSRSFDQKAEKEESQKAERDERTHIAVSHAAAPV